MRLVTDLGENEVIHCPTIEEAEAICMLMDGGGLRWNGGDSYLEKNHWGVYNQNTCYCPKQGGYNPIGFSKEYRETIYAASEFLTETKMKHLIKFEELKVDQEVWTIKSGYCKIKSLLDKPEYPILTDDGITYTKLGMVASGNKHPSLFLSNPFEGSERVVEVRDSEKHKWERRVFIKIMGTQTLTWTSSIGKDSTVSELIEDARRQTETDIWNFMRELPTKTVLTKQQISEKFGVEVDNLEIEL